MIVVDQAIVGYRVVLGCIACQTRIDGGEAPALAALVELAEAHVREAHRPDLWVDMTERPGELRC